MVRFLSFSSGSCGNCSLLLLETDGCRQGILLDAGVSVRRIRRVLAAEGVDPGCIRAVLVTHDHLDHIRHLGALCKYLSIPVYATETLHRSLSVHAFTRDFIGPCRKTLGPGWTQVAEGFGVMPFEVPHDASETVGFAIRADGHRFLFMTDLGSVPPEAMDLALRADTVVIESNHDVGMLLGGSYAYSLKMRICKDFGHLANEDCAEAVRSFYHPGLKNLFLCHLSGNNNTPQLAYDTTARALSEMGVEPGMVRLRVLPRGVETPLLNLD